MDVDVVENIASFIMSQHYINIEDSPLETIFIFPVDNDTIFSKLTIDFTLKDGTTKSLETVIEER